MLSVGSAVGDGVITVQRAALAASTHGASFSSPSRRDLVTLTGENNCSFNAAPACTEMNLCNIHFHENAEHKGGQFTSFAGNGDAKKYGTGFRYDGELTDAESVPLDAQIADKGYGGLEPGDTIELHYVHTTAQIEPGPKFGACLSDSIMNPQLRVETQVYVLVNDEAAADFVSLTKVAKVGEYHQAVNIPTTTGELIQYDGSTTGPSYNEKGSLLQVSWSVRSKVVKVKIATIATWLDNNIFDEDHAHAVRNLVVNPALISNIN